MSEKMLAAYLPGDGSTEMKYVDVPEPGHGEVLISTKACTVCGSDIKGIYHRPREQRPETFRNNIAGHEPCGVVAKCGPGMRRFKEGDRVIVYHISGCGICFECRKGYLINCSSPTRAAYGWDRDGGMAKYVLADEKDLVPLPDNLSYIDGAMIACGFGTVYEGLENIGVSGKDTVLVVGLGPVGLAALMVAKALGAKKTIGLDVVKERCDIALGKGIADHALISGADSLDALMKLTGGRGVDKAVDCSGSPAGRQLAVKATGKWGNIAFIGEGSTVEFAPSNDLMHYQKTIYGSWVTSIWRMEELTMLMSAWGVHPDALVTHKFSLEQAPEAFALMDGGKCGKVAVVFD
ncbi:MAG: zinc-binding dehydrogenase [Oscillospiraceae bacterium]|nr:zinc-binding dehydrogenase [Oscillospiraceae bacterium]